MDLKTDAGAAALRGERIEASREEEGGAAGKRAATLMARAALAGFELVRQADGAWLASRWGQFRTLVDDAEVEHFLIVVEAPV